MADVLTHRSTLQEVEDFLKGIHGDDHVTDADTESVHRSIQAHNGWRNSLSVDDRMNLNDVPVSTKPETLSQDNVPEGVTVVDAGKDNSPSPSSDKPQITAGGER
jgi:hypothetical protein